MTRTHTYSQNESTLSTVRCQPVDLVDLDDPADGVGHAGWRGAREPGGQRFRRHAVQYQSAHDGGEFGGHHGVQDHAFGTERGFADADRNGYAAGDRHGGARNRELGGRHAELQAGLVHHDLGQSSGGRGDRGYDSTADRAGRFVRDLRRYRRTAAGFFQRADSGAGAGHAAGWHACGGGALAEHGPGVRPGGGNGAGGGLGTALSEKLAQSLSVLHTQWRHGDVTQMGRLGRGASPTWRRSGEVADDVRAPRVFRERRLPGAIRENGGGKGHFTKPAEWRLAVRSARVSAMAFLASPKRP